jgi:hypothetical protein
MSQAVQERTKVSVVEEMNSKLSFVLPKDLLSDSRIRRPLTVFRSDDFEAVLPEAQHPDLHKLCAELMPSETWCQVDHIIVSRVHDKDLGETHTKVEVQLDSLLVTSCRGRIDAALRICDIEPIT